MLRHVPLIRLLILIGLVLTMAALLHVAGVDFERFTPIRIKQWILGFGMWAPVVFIAIYALRAVVLFLPVGVMSLAGGLAFGRWWGTLYILVGATLGSCLGFLTARYFGREFVESLPWFQQGRIRKFDEKAAEHGFKLILFLRLVPLFQYDAVNFGSGLSKVTLRDFALASFIGMAPGGFISASLGASLVDILSIDFFAAVAAFIALLFVPLIYRKLKRNRISH